MKGSGRGTHSAVACSQICLPVVVVQPISQQLATMLRCSKITGLNKIRCFLVVSRRKLFSRSFEKYISQLPASPLGTGSPGREGTGEDTQDRVDIALCKVRCLEMHCDNHVSMKIISCNVGRQVIHDGAIY